jgi:hypothetical protein
MIHGSSATAAISGEDIIVQEKPIRIFSRACPDIMFANSRIERLNILATYETPSIIVRNGAIRNGAPLGRKS